MNRLCAGILTCSALLWATPLVTPARAELLIEYSIDGGTTFNTLCSAASGGACSNSTTAANGITLAVQGASSNSPGTPSLAELLAAAVSVTNTSSIGSAGIELLIGDTDFTRPSTTPLTFESQIGGTVVTGGANSLSFFSCLDTGNAQNSCPGSLSTAILSPSITTGSTAYDAANSTTVNSLSTPYSISEELTLTLAAGANLNYAASSELGANISAVPEPASLLLFGTGLLCMGLLYGRRGLYRS